MTYKLAFDPRLAPETVQSIHVLDKSPAIAEAYIQALGEAVREHPQALISDEVLPTGTALQRREHFRDEQLDTIGCLDELGRVTCAASVSYSGMVAEAGYL